MPAVLKPKMVGVGGRKLVAVVQRPPTLQVIPAPQPSLGCSCLAGLSQTSLAELGLIYILLFLPPDPLITLSTY